MHEYEALSTHTYTHVRLSPDNRTGYVILPQTEGMRPFWERLWVYQKAYLYKNIS